MKKMCTEDDTPRISSTFEQDTNCKVSNLETDTKLDQILGKIMGRSV